MNSFAHYSFGAVYQWMVENIGGIQSNGPGYRTITIAPVPGPRLTSPTVSYRCVHGLIRSEWKKEGDRFTIGIQIPVNTRATILLPARRGSVLESGKPCTARSDVEYLGRRDGECEAFSVGSGLYQFETVLP